MGYHGYSSCKRWNEFAAHVKAFEVNSEAHTSFGNLHFTRSAVYSYNLQIASIWKQDRIICWKPDHLLRSRTTSMHVGAVIRATHLLPDYLYLAVPNERCLSLHPFDLARAIWNPALCDWGAMDALQYYQLVRKSTSSDMLTYTHATRDVRARMRLEAELSQEKQV